MTLVLFLFVSCSLATVISGDVCECPHADTHYKELGCTPVQGTGCCPDRFDCSHLKGRSKDKCYVNGQEYEIGDRIPEDVMNSLCSKGCFCAEGYPAGSQAKITCAHADCFSPWQSGCISQYTLDSCCQIAKVCGTDKIAELAKCEVDGKEYREGERMYPKSSPCQRCICQKGFAGQIEEPFCKKLTCGIEEHYTRNIKDKCAPTYLTNSCCPSTWRCHEPSDIIVPGPTSKSTDDHAMTCKFGETVLNVGDTFASNMECVTCGCFVPPLASCIMDRPCKEKIYEERYQ